MDNDKKVRIIIIDDEMLAREKIRTFLSTEKGIEIVAECKDGNNAVNRINSLKPDLIFLDIHMPGMSGFDILKSIKFIPVIIFTTAYDKYAIKAFEVFALDYLLKPFDRDRFIKSLNRAREHLKNRRTDLSSQKIINLLKDLKSQKELPSQPAFLDRMVIKSSGRIFFLKTIEIDWIEASGNYLRIFSKDESYLIRDTMNNIEKKLDPENFIRIHRSVIVNIESTKELKPWFNGEYLVFMKNGKKLTSSKTYKNNLLRVSKS